ncbi:hypothetical protein ANN_05097 [Periplaneta americana]|uniref:Uncharacterized protein n=1 Tax=Periplaneta americana TaxID=6978 RepID=A0ABQ8TA76_PERAM|nr:hypothetical protein ANN_05097 [Periplaneta americana]
MVGEWKFEVCKKAFTSQLLVRRLRKLILLDKSPEDNRGKQQNQKTNPITTVMQVKDRIASFPLETSHYSSKEVNYLHAKFGRPQIDTCCDCEEPQVRVKSPALNETAKRSSTNCSQKEEL